MATYINYTRPDLNLQLNNGDILAGDIRVNKLIIPSGCVVKVRPYWEIINNSGVFHNTTNDPGGFVNIKANEVVIGGTLDATGSGYPGGGGGEGGCGADDREDKAPNHNGSGIGIGGQNGYYSNFDSVRGSFESAAGGNGGKGMSVNGFDINGGIGGGRAAKFGKGYNGANGMDGVPNINNDLSINAYMGSGGGGGGGGSGGGGNTSAVKCGGGGGGGGGGGNGGGIIRIFAFKSFILDSSGSIISNGSNGENGDNGYHGGFISPTWDVNYPGRKIYQAYSNKHFYELWEISQVSYAITNWGTNYNHGNLMGAGGRGGNAGSGSSGLGGSWGRMQYYAVFGTGDGSGAGGAGGKGGGGAGGSIIIVLGLDYDQSINKFKGTYRGHKIIRRFIVNGTLSTKGYKIGSNQSKYLTTENGGTIKVFYINENRDFNYSKNNCNTYIEKEFNNIVLI